MSPTTFFGVFDPDGRPWYFKRNYDAAIEYALKAALLTQQHLILPAGYLLDNPAFHRILVRYSSDNTEAKAFRLLLKSAIIISLSKGISSQTSGPPEWEDLLQHWILGTTSSRAKLVYLNCIPHTQALRLQNLPAVDIFRREMSLAFGSSFSLNDYINLLNQIGFTFLEQKNLPFNEVLNKGLLSGHDKFSTVSESILEKLSEITTAATRHQHRVSRSLLHNNQMCIDLGVPARLALSHGEYMQIASVLAHYHHHAFAMALGTDAFLTRHAPRTQRALERLMSDAFRDLEISEGDITGQSELQIPLRHITYEKIFKVRLGSESHKFYENLQAIELAARSIGQNSYTEALEKHLFHIAQVVSLDFRPIDPELLVSAVRSSISLDRATSSDAVGTLKLAFLVMRDLAPNLKADLQTRWFLRRLLKADATESNPESSNNPRETSNH